MCGVFGYLGRESDVARIILSALKTLEYRGYDSWGLAICTADGIVVDKEVGRINGHVRNYPSSHFGVGHTRWATHGGVTVANAHPHVDSGRRIAVVHNGIIENHASLRAGLLGRGHRFSSETDSEVVVHLVSDQLAEGHSLAAAVSYVFGLLHGYNAIVVLDRQEEQFAAVKRVSPLVLGRGRNASTVASDAIALRGQADELIHLEDDQLALASASGIEIFDRATLRAIEPAIIAVPERQDDITLGDHADFMSKEIAEQPEALRRVVQESRYEIERLANDMATAERVVLVGCGTAAHAALAGAYMFSQHCARDVTPVPASEFRHRTGFLDAQTLVVAISQSGETLDVLEAMDEARRKGSRLAAIVNTPYSSLDRMVTTSVHLRCGVEQCVLATKSYTAMLATLLLTAFQVNQSWSEGAKRVLAAASALELMMRDEAHAQTQSIAARIARAEHLFVIGRGIHFPSALEAALKIKEVSYVHAEGFAAGELKHGVIALVESGTPCLVFAANDATRTDVLSGAAELKSRGGYIIGVGNERNDVFDEFIELPDVGAANMIVESLPGQLLGYYAALSRGNDPDRPRNLAKSVTVK